ncbi:MAG: enoyl-CoA hydratase, partial [Chloroflexi bacterium]|nr:enoyl-CoA hydratase [Chloroflexota bacterium]
GYGFSMAMFCDMRFVSESAMFTTAFAPRGLVAEHGMSWILPRLLGTSRALDILWSGRKFGAEEALQLGVANRVVAPEQLLPETHTFIRELGEKCSPTSLMHMKQQIYRDLMERLDDSMRDTESRMAASVKRPDFKEGIASFMERRPPEFPRIGT